MAVSHSTRRESEISLLAAPDLGEFTDSLLHGDVWRRPGLILRERCIVTLAVLISTGRTALLEPELHRALDSAVIPAEISGLLTHLAFYTGWPNALAAAPTVEHVFAERRINMATLAASAERSPPLPTDAEQNQATMDSLGGIAPRFAQMTTEVLFGDLWLRTDLTPRLRSLVTICALAANGDESSLPYHLPRAAANGLTGPEVMEAFTHMAFYAGWPKASAAVWQAASVFDFGQ